MQPNREMQAVLVRSRIVVLVRGIDVCISSCVAGWTLCRHEVRRRWVHCLTGFHTLIGRHHKKGIAASTHKKALLLLLT